MDRLEATSSLTAPFGRQTNKGVPNVIFAGRNVPGVRTNVYLKPHGLPHNRVLVSLCQMMGLKDVTTFGNPKFGSGTIPGLLT